MSDRIPSQRHRPSSPAPGCRHLVRPKVAARLRDDSGVAAVTLLVIGMIVILFAGALLGGGALFAARAHGFDLAQSAARAGAQQLDTATYRTTGVLRLDPARAAQAAKQFLAAGGASGAVQVTAARITVTATSHQATPMLKPFGIADVTVTATASATPTTGPPA
jgi:Flp pilus assembly protein TadG